MERGGKTGGEATRPACYTISSIFQQINPINMPCYIKGGGGVQTPCLPHVGLKEERGGGRRTLLVQLGLGAQAPPSLLGAAPPLGPSQGPCRWEPPFFLYLINIKSY